MVASTERMSRLATRLVEGGAEVLHATPANLSQTIIGLIGQRGWHRLVSVRRNRVGHPSVMGDDPELTEQDLAQLDAVITESAAAVVDLGAVALDHSPGQGRAALTKIEGIHVCVVEETDVVDDLAAARERLGPGEITWIGGPSAGSEVVEILARPLIAVLVGAPDPRSDGAPVSG